VVELVRGTTLRRLLQERGHLPAEVTAAIGLEVAEGLAHAHEHGVIHRDVKPENVLVEMPEIGRTRTSERPGQNLKPCIKITDFGIAKLLDAQGVTSTGQVLGSPAHMSPEQIEGGEVSARSDVFGLGVLLYELMVGKLPFDGKNPAQVLRRVLDGHFTPADRARPTVGAEWSRILAKALARDAEGRYENCEEFGFALRDELERLGFSDARRELHEFLVEPERYRADYEQRVFTRLVELGRRARAERAMPLAASSFNRALAFRPDDTELLGLVAGLARGERMREVGRRSAAIAALCVVAGLVMFAGTHWLRGPPATHGASEVETRTRPPLIVPRLQPRGPIIVHGDAQAPRTQTREPVRRPKTPVVQPAAKPRGTRQVQVHIRGAAGRLKIDGAEAPWYGRSHELSLGSHVLEFVPPTSDCCIAPPAKSIEVVAGEGIQQEHGEIGFKDAVVSFSGPEGAEASCAELAARLSPGGSRAVQMATAELSIRCTVFPPASEGADPKTQELTLRPGSTAMLTWP
ncbi:MAG TPA: serine/threonine-protein kinase, partial [Polyangiaceae bacterium]|nr:serine/threonine-protein kinase [Polyangiaceae bacterium]